mmetsp:Transcript_14346/g.58440  ORF Transcript_14346/g.58440 Transcript_14346/m.58440 type:complete len:252 (-) Transcript_14346:605-1360(-)
MTGTPRGTPAFGGASGVTSTANLHRIALWFFSVCEVDAAASRRIASVYASLTLYMLSTATIPSTTPALPLAMMGSTAHAIMPFGGSPPLANVPGGVPLSSLFFSLARCAAISLSDLRVYTFGSIPPAAGATCVSCTRARTLAVAARAGMEKAPVVDADPDAPINPPVPLPLSSRSPPPLACWFHAKCMSSDMRPRAPCSVLNAFWPKSTRAMVPSTRSRAPASKLTARTVTENRCSRLPSAAFSSSRKPSR